MSMEVRTLASALYVTDIMSGYTLEVQKEPITDYLYWNQAFFSINSHKEGVEDSPIIITGRDSEDYMKNLEGLQIDIEKQYVEIAAGLGGFIPAMVDEFKAEMQYKPIVIDSANYNIMKKLLTLGIKSAFEERYPQEARDRLDTLMKRADFYLTSPDIRMINLELEEALRKFPELKGIADMIVEYNLSSSYDNLHIEEARKSLLNKKGIAFVG